MSTTATRRWNALVVGGTSGIGKGIALALAERGCNVTIAGRSSKDVLPLLVAASSDPQQEHSFVPVDGFELKTLVQLTAPDLLVMTHGMATTQGYTPTVDGIDQKMQLHCFSRVYLAQTLAPHMMEGGRILTVLSAGVHSRFENYPHDFDLKNTYSIQNAANAAGFYSDVAFEKLSNQYPNLVFCHAAPGFVNTNWGSEMPWYLKGLVRTIQPFGRSLESCGQILTDSWLKLPVNGTYHLMDSNGKKTKQGVQHRPDEVDVIWNKIQDLLPLDKLKETKK